MNTKSLKRGNFQRYSFKDLEYGLRLIQAEADDIRDVIKTLNRLEERKIINVGTTTIKSQMEREINRIEEIVKMINDEVANRLLTGDDDGFVANELGAVNV